MSKGKTKKPDPSAKRPDETDLQWRSRLAREQETKRKLGEDVITPERRAKGDLEEVGAKEQGRHRSYRAKCRSAALRLYERGALSAEQAAAAVEIRAIAERVMSAVSVKGASLEGRVDCQSGANDSGLETLRRVRAEQAYNEWRLKIPSPRGMVLEMIFEDSHFAAIAKQHNSYWRKAIMDYKNALDLWGDCLRSARARIHQEDLDNMMRKAS